MPPRSEKMNRFIFGFHRRVWWPKWTPASSSARMETADTRLSPVRFRLTPAGRTGASRAARHRRCAGSAGEWWKTDPRSLARAGLPAGASLRERGLEVGRERRRDVDRPVAVRVREAQPRRVEELAVEPELGAVAVGRVAADRMADRGQ